jgi:hypothetical protein
MKQNTKSAIRAHRTWLCLARWSGSGKC